jgi:hypothetical protein
MAAEDLRTAIVDVERVDTARRDREYLVLPLLRFVLGVVEVQVAGALGIGEGSLDCALMVEGCAIWGKAVTRVRRARACASRRIRLRVRD